MREIVKKLPRHTQREIAFTRTAAADEYRQSAGRMAARKSGTPMPKAPPLPPPPVKHASATN